MAMTSKERVLSSICHVEPDRVPSDYSANRFVQEALLQHLRLHSHRELLQYLHVDIVDLRRVADPDYIGPIPARRVLPGHIVENYWGMRTKVIQTATGFEEYYVDFLLKDATSVDEIEKHTWPKVDWYDFADIHSRIKEWSDFAVMVSGASVFQHPTFLRSLDNLLIDMLLSPDMANCLLDKFTDFYLAYFDKLFATASGLVDIFRIADDFGMQDKPLISIDLFKEYFAPRIRKLVDMAHSHKVKVMFHSCGAIDPLIPHLIDLGIDLLDPIQPCAKDMSPTTLKSKYGDKLCLHGAIDTQFLLPKGSTQDVYKEVRNLVDRLGCGGGYILAPSHVLQMDVPLDNILALYDAAYMRR